jgi:hypothetical protein
MDQAVAAAADQVAAAADQATSASRTNRWLHTVQEMKAVQMTKAV